MSGTTAGRSPGDPHPLRLYLYLETKESVMTHFRRGGTTYSSAKGRRRRCDSRPHAAELPGNG